MAELLPILAWAALVATIVVAVSWPHRPVTLAHLEPDPPLTETELDDPQIYQAEFVDIADTMPDLTARMALIAARLDPDIPEPRKPPQP